MATIWIVNQYALPASQKRHARHNQFAESLAKLGHSVTIISADYHHLMLKSRNEVETSGLAYDIHLVSVPHYKTAHDRRRVLAWLVFAFKLCWLPKKLKQKPDIIIASSPSLLSFLGAEWIANRNKSKLIFEIRDIWPLTLIGIGNYSKKHPFIKFLQWVENRALMKSDNIITTMPGGPDYVKSQIGIDNKTCWIPNGIDLDVSSKIHADTEQTGQNSEQFLVGYTGTLGLANSVDTIISAAYVLKNDTSVQFLIMGDGRCKEDLINRVRSLELSNVKFIPKGSEEEVTKTLEKLDAALLCWNKSTLYRFGTSAIKLPRYLAAGKPIIHAYSGNYDPIMLNKVGTTIPAENGEALAKAIKQLQSMPKHERIQLSENARKLASTHYSFKVLTKRLEEILLQ